MLRSAPRSGQSMVEFALIAPLLFFVLFGIIELGIMFNIYISLTNSAREAARAGAIYQYVMPSSATTVDTATIDTGRSLTINTAIADTLNPLITPASIMPTITYTPTTALATNPYRSGQYVTVGLEHSHTLFFGVLGPTNMPIRATSTMRIEPGGVR